MTSRDMGMNFQHVDLDTLEKFTFRARDTNIPPLTFLMSADHERTGILKDEKRYMTPHLAMTAISRYNELLDIGYSVALNEKCYRMDEIRNYANVKIVQIEIDILLKSAKIFCKVEKLYKMAEMNQHISQSAQLLVDRLFKRILHFSSSEV